ncbi:MAG: hypothetical protein K940chlam1_00343 [Candidatus Anoxychlamydiales bacterium]|nr:hypothetical protein [Candidatus Anoxychlamydiales bacterium]NGX35292.1 hypothetical protein [Candidatus Anoxychlamydiales bacterium]
MKKLFTIFIAILAFNTLIAYENDYSDSNNCCPKPEPCGCDIPGEPTTAAYNQGANIDVCGSWDFYVTGSFLYWQPREQQLEIAQSTFLGTDTTSTAEIGSIHKLSFDWEPAFKIGVGYIYGYDNWESYLQYTRVNSSSSSTANNDNRAGEVLIDAWLLQPNDPNLSTNSISITGKWDLNFNILDWEFGRTYYNGKKLTFKPHFGLKGGWINQSMRITDVASSTLTYDGTFKSNSWLIGPRAGIYTNWLFCDGFRAFGNAAASIFYQKFHKLQYREPSAVNPSEWYLADNSSFTYINPSLEFVLGCGWGTYFSNNNWHFDFLVGYEAQVYFSQNLMRSQQQTVASGAPFAFNNPGNLTFQGLTATARFDF